MQFKHKICPKSLLAIVIMSITVIGINHKTAAISVREKVYFAVDKLGAYLQDLLQRGDVREAVLLSTCNRSELYCETDDVAAARAWFCEQTTASRAELESALYIYRGADAVAHIMAVACGLDSMVVGEPQILGQMKEVFSESCTAGAVDALFHRLFQQVFSVAKEIRTSTAIGACPVSVASAAAHFAKQQVTDFTHSNVLLIGAGDTTELLARYLKTHLAKPITVVNRSVEKAWALMEAYGCQVESLDNLIPALANADIVFSATGSAQPIVDKKIMLRVMRARKEKPIFLIDIAVPRDIDANVVTLANVKLYCIDDLKVIIEKNRQGREHAADKARELIRKKSTDFIAETSSFDKAAYTIRAYRSQIEALCRGELIKAKQQLQQGVDPAQVLDLFAHAFTRKLLHAPSVQLRQAGVAGQVELLRFAKQIFALTDFGPETEYL